jgi:hypothetical protein
MLLFKPTSPWLDDRHRALENATEVHPGLNMSVWSREDIPDRFHYKNNRRAPPLVALADEGWLMTVHWYNARYVRWGLSCLT